MTKITNIKSINWSRLHIYFFYLFLLSIPFQTRKVFLTQYSFYSGAFTEYATFFVYASDVFLALALFFWLVFNRPKFIKTSLSQSVIPSDPQGVERSVNRQTFISKRKTPKLRKIWLFLFAFIIWLIINTIINSKYLEISVFQIIKFIELFLLVVYIYFNLTSKKALLASLFVISLAGFLQSLIAIYQFIFQQSLFNSPILAKITGETTIGPQIPGIAKIVIDGEKMIRAYGTLPHSNILGGFLILSSVISIYLLLEHKYTILSRCKSNYIQFYNTKFKKSQAQTTISLIWIVVIFAQITALLFTFSRSAWAGFAISVAVLLFLFRLFHVKQSRNVSRETFLNFKRKLNCYLLAIFISFLFIGLFDHYFWTLQQGRLIFWLVFGILLIDMRFKVKGN